MNLEEVEAVEVVVEGFLVTGIFLGIELDDHQNLSSNTQHRMISVVLGLLGLTVLGYGIACSVQRDRKACQLLAWVRTQHPGALVLLPWYVNKLMNAEMILGAVFGKRLITEPVFQQRYAEVQHLRYKTVGFVLLGLAFLYIGIRCM